MVSKLRNIHTYIYIYRPYDQEDDDEEWTSPLSHDNSYEADEGTIHSANDDYAQGYDHFEAHEAAPDTAMADQQLSQPRGQGPIGGKLAAAMAQAQQPSAAFTRGEVSDNDYGDEDEEQVGQRRGCDDGTQRTREREYDAEYGDDDGDEEEAEQAGGDGISGWDQGKW